MSKSVQEPHRQIGSFKSPKQLLEKTSKNPLQFTFSEEEFQILRKTENPSPQRYNKKNLNSSNVQYQTTGGNSPRIKHSKENLSIKEVHPPQTPHMKRYPVHDNKSILSSNQERAISESDESDCRTEVLDMVLNSIEARFQEIENTMQQENLNLKEHNEYLLSVIKKMQEKERKRKNEIKQYEQMVRTLKQENGDIITRKSELEDIIQAVKVSCQFGKNYQFDSFTTDHSLTSQSENRNLQAEQKILKQGESLKDLSESLDENMKKYEETHDPEVIKKCVELASRIRKLKNEQILNLNN